MSEINENTTVREIYLRGWIASLQLERVVFADFCNKDDHSVITLYGGFNGPNRWDVYMKQISAILESLPGSWLVSLVNDCPDDVWTLKIGIPKSL